MKIAGNGSTSRLYQKLVSEEKIAAGAGGWYSGSGLDSGSIGVYATAAQGVGLDKVEQSIDAVLHELREKLVTDDELERAKKAFIAEFIYEFGQPGLAGAALRRGLIVGLTIDEINNWPVAVVQGDRRRREARGEQVSGHPPLGDRHADPDSAGGGKRHHASPPRRRSPRGGSS